MSGGVFRKWSLTFTALMASGVLMANPIVNINGIDVENAVSQITFEGDNVVIHFQNGTSESEDMDGVVVKFSPETNIPLAFNEVLISNALVKDELVIKGIPASTSLRIFDAIGQLKLQTSASDGENRINVSNLSQGVYLLLLDKTMVKFVKK